MNPVEAFVARFARRQVGLAPGVIDEVKVHLEEASDELRATGLPPEEAQKEAVKRFGWPKLPSERGLPWWKSPCFLTTAGCLLAIAGYELVGSTHMIPEPFNRAVYSLWFPLTFGYGALHLAAGFAERRGWFVKSVAGLALGIFVLAGLSASNSVAVGDRLESPTEAAAARQKLTQSRMDLPRARDKAASLSALDGRAWAPAYYFGHHPERNLALIPDYDGAMMHLGFRAYGSPQEAATQWKWFDSRSQVWDADLARMVADYDQAFRKPVVIRGFPTALRFVAPAAAGVSLPCLAFGALAGWLFRAIVRRRRTFRERPC